MDQSHTAPIPYQTQAMVQRMKAEFEQVRLGGIVHVQGPEKQGCAYGYGTEGKIRLSTAKYLLQQLATNWGDGETRAYVQELLACQNAKKEKTEEGQNAFQ